MSTVVIPLVSAASILLALGMAYTAMNQTLRLVRHRAIQTRPEERRAKRRQTGHDRRWDDTIFGDRTPPSPGRSL